MACHGIQTKMVVEFGKNTGCRQKMRLSPNQTTPTNRAEHNKKKTKGIAFFGQLYDLPLAKDFKFA